MFFALVLLVSTGGSCGKQENGTNALAGWEKMGHEDDPSEEPSENPSVDESTDPDESKDPDADRWFQTRGIVCGWSDVNPYHEHKIDYISLAKEHHLNTFSIYGATRTSGDWTAFMSAAAKVGVKFEFQEHMMSFLLPRDLFNSHPEYFRMNKQGVRVEDANGCPSSDCSCSICNRNRTRFLFAMKHLSKNNVQYYTMEKGFCPPSS